MTTSIQPHISASGSAPKRDWAILDHQLWNLRILGHTVLDWPVDDFGNEADGALFPSYYAWCCATATYGGFGVAQYSGDYTQDC